MSDTVTLKDMAHRFMYRIGTMRQYMLLPGFPKPIGRTRPLRFDSRRADKWFDKHQRAIAKRAQVKIARRRRAVAYSKRRR